MSYTVLLMFLIIILIIVVSIVTVVLLIIKESNKKKNSYVDYNSIPKEENSNKNLSANIISPTDRISDMDIEYLKKLKDLKESGVLSNEEYNAKRDKVLRG